MSLTSRALNLTYALTALLLILATTPARADEPIKIGLGMSLTG